MLRLQTLTYLVLILPLVSGVVVGGFVRSNRLAHRLCIAGVAASFVASLFLMQAYLQQPSFSLTVPGYVWLALEGFSCSMGFYLDGLSLPMVMMVSGVSTMIHVYAIGYMHEDPGYVRFFSCISLFTFAMLWLLLTDNVIGLFFGWEGVSLFSYFLIGYYYFTDSAANASVKAFVINRLGDCALCLGILVLIFYVGSPQYADIMGRIDGLQADTMLLWGSAVSVLPLVASLLFVGAMSKSAQMPLHIWLPDSMEGPTPFSALIHAATMVTAGVYLMCRFSVLLPYAQTLCVVIAFLAASGIFWLGILAISETDIKRIAAYSTLSQLSYMMLAVALGAYQLAIFHLIVHAFFKACLFMAIGSVIHATRHVQNIHKLGGLLRVMPVTAACYFISACALAGIVPFAGFYSKELIMEVLHKMPFTGFVSYYVSWLAFGGLVITPLYAFRLFFLVFVKKSDSDHQFVYESPLSMLVSMSVLAILSLTSGPWLLPVFVNHERFNFSGVASQFNYLHDVLLYVQHLVAHGIYQHVLFSPGTYLTFFGVFLAWLLFKKGYFAKDAPGAGTLLNEILRQGYGFEWLRLHLIQPTVVALASFLAWQVDQWSINGSIEYYFGAWVSRQSEKFSRFQPSLLTRYIAFIWLSMLLMLLVLLLRSLFYSGVVI